MWQVALSKKGEVRHLVLFADIGLPVGGMQVPDVGSGQWSDQVHTSIHVGVQGKG